MPSRDRLTGGELNGALTDELAGVQTGDVTEAHGLFRQEMEVDMRAVVERLTGHKVLVFLSASDIDPDVAAAIVCVRAQRG